MEPAREARDPRDARPLVLLLCAVAISLVTWALLVPPFAVPDEAAHVAYVQSLAERGERPRAGAPGDRLYSSELRWARGAIRTNRIVDPQLKPAWEPGAERLWERYRPRLGVRGDDAKAIGAQANHPPLYYAYEAIPYTAPSGGDVFDRIFAMRVWSALLMLVTTTGAWLLIGELTDRDRLLQLAGSACVGLQPMATFVSAGVNPDALLFASYSMALWLAVRLVRRGPSRAPLAGLLAATAAAVLVKPAGLALVPAVVLVLAVLARRGGFAPRLSAVAGVGLAAVLVLVGVVGEREIGARAPLDLDPGALRGFATYLWDFYLPRLPFQNEYAALAIDNPAQTVWVEYTWAAFGLLDVRFPEPVYFGLAGVALATFASAAVAVARRRFRPDRNTLAIFGLVAACLVLGLHWVDFQSVRDDHGRVMQGRYLLPLMPIVGVAVAAGLSNLSRRLRELGAALILAGMAVLQLFSLALVAGRYLA
ncbi:MAG TPA: DUF2142 domain-containing protein [Thermoleophilaceae bacterium]